MNLSLFARNNLSNLPLPLGQIVAYTPYCWRPGIGSTYRQRQREIRLYENLQEKERKEWIFQRVRRIVRYAVTHVPFYQTYYEEQKFSVDELRGFDDIVRIPAIDKGILQSYDLELRSCQVEGRYLENTGGSSGRTLAFYVQSAQMGNEWAHMHTIWAKLGYSSRHLKLTFGGRSDIKDGIKYDFVRHSVAVNIYKDLEAVASELKALLEKYKIHYLHGYPSALYEFALFCKNRDTELVALLEGDLKGAFLASEYPMPHYRQVIENVFGIPSISWYGHTERCILAYERHEPYVYFPFQTYGFAEACHLSSSYPVLVGTSYYNFASPLIRYNTEDELTEVQQEGGLLKAFKIDHGRKGQFIVDSRGQNIPLTGLIFGRHHKLFEYCSHIQIYQPQPGKAVILFVPLTEGGCPHPERLFDARNVDIRFDFHAISQPIRTASGKINLLVTANDMGRNQDLVPLGSESPE